MELYEYSAASLRSMMAEKQCSSTEVTKSVLDRITAVEDKVKAYITVLQDSALEQAAIIDKRRAAGETLAPLAGIPVGVKDNICTKGVKTTCASRILAEYLPPYSATVVNKLEAAGAVITGKLNLDEFAMGSTCENSSVYPTANPHDLSRVPGGSSGGSSAAVAAGECVVALGSDTGGSIRLPASYCGIVGLKPTYGTVSRYGAVAFASSLEQIGPMGRSVEDVALLYSTLCGEDKMDATTVSHQYPDFAQNLHTEVAGKIIGIPKEYFGGGVDAAVAATVMEAAKTLEKQGAILKEVSLPSTPHALAAYYIIACAEASSNLARFDGVRYGYRTAEYADLTEMYEKTRSEGFGDEVKRRIMLGTYVLSSGYYDAYYKRAKLLQQQVTAEFTQVFADCDCLITPTAPSVAGKLGDTATDPIKSYSADICTVTVNIAGLPAISVPCGKGEGGMPVGMQLIGAKFSEQLLMQMAYQYETVTGGPWPVPAIL